MENQKVESRDSYYPAVGNRTPITPTKSGLASHGRTRDKKTHFAELARCSTEKARRRIPFSSAIRMRILPLSVIDSPSGDEIFCVVSSASLTPETLKELRFLLGGEIVAEVVEDVSMSRAIHAAYFGGGGALESAAEKSNTLLSPSSLSENTIPRSKKAIPQFVEALFHRAASLSASDIHLEPQGDEVRIRIRVDGTLRVQEDVTLSRKAAADISRRLKILASLDITETFKPLEGSFTFYTGERNLRLRISIIPVSGGEKIVLRLFDDEEQTPSRRPGDSRSFQDLGLHSPQEELLRVCLGQNRGTVLLSGPTGSGKSTLLYAILRYLNDPTRNIVTIEDPIEREISGVAQSAVAVERGLDYSELLRCMLRQDPDVIMLGEIRDSQAAHIALTAGLTGHIVLSTIHSGTALEVFLRLRQFGVSLQLIASSIKLVGTQRLLPLSCTSCLQETILTERARTLFRLRADVRVYAGRGCELCAGSGVAGRMGVFEFLPLTGDLRRALLECGNSPLAEEELRQVAQLSTKETLFGGIRRALSTGKISPQAALITCGLDPLLCGYPSSST